MRRFLVCEGGCGDLSRERLHLRSWVNSYPRKPAFQISSEESRLQDSTDERHTTIKSAYPLSHNWFGSYRWGSFDGAEAPKTSLRHLKSL